MKKEKIGNRTILTAEKGMVLMRDGERVQTALPADGVDENLWYEITEKEYQKILEETQ